MRGFSRVRGTARRQRECGQKNHSPQILKYLHTRQNHAHADFTQTNFLIETSLADSTRIHYPESKMQAPPFLREDSTGVFLSIKLQPHASMNQIGQPIGRELRIKVTAPPVDSAANEALLRLLAGHFDCPRNQIELVRGQTSRHKLIKLHGLTAETLLEKLSQR